MRSARGTQFRRWATERLRDYLVNGFLLDDECLKNPPVGDSAAPDRFNVLLERIRDIRASERRMYLRVREIFAMAADYSPSLPETTRFFCFIQNKLHFAVTGKTAAELIAERADSTQPHMGLATWKSGSVQKADVTMPKRNMSSSPPSGGRCWSPKGPSSICVPWKKLPKPCPSPHKGEATPPPSTSRPLKRPTKP